MSRFAAVRSRFVAVRKWINGASAVSKADNSLRWKPKKDMSDIYPSWVFNSCNSNKVKVMPKEALSNKKVSRIIVSEVDSTNWSLVWPLKNNHEIPDKSSGTLYIYSWNQLFRNPGRGGKDRGWVFQQLHPWAGPASAARGEASAAGQPGERERERMREFGREWERDGTDGPRIWVNEDVSEFRDASSSNNQVHFLCHTFFRACLYEISINLPLSSGEEDETGWAYGAGCSSTTRHQGQAGRQAGGGGAPSQG